MHAIRLGAAALAGALALSACDGRGITDARTPVRSADIDYQCPDPNSCGGGTPALSYASSTDVVYVYNFNSPDSKVAKGTSWSQGIAANITATRVDATAYKFFNCLASNRAFYQTLSKQASGPSYVQVNFRYEYPAVYKYGFQVLGTHTFSVAPGDYGGGTFSSEASQCDLTGYGAILWGQ
jgi:hypothetical protein